MAPLFALGFFLWTHHWVTAAALPALWLLTLLFNSYVVTRTRRILGTERARYRADHPLLKQDTVMSLFALVFLLLYATHWILTATFAVLWLVDRTMFARFDRMGRLRAQIAAEKMAPKS